MKKSRNEVIKKVGKLLGSKPKEESLSAIFEPLNGIEEKVTIRQAIIKENVLKLEEAKSKIDAQIETYNAEMELCDKYLNNINKFT